MNADEPKGRLVKPVRRRRRFGSRWSWVALLCLTVTSQAADRPRGGRVGWARLETSHSIWSIHNDRDSQLAEFIHEQTSLNIDPRWYSVRADVEQLSAYPFVYAKDLTHVRGGGVEHLAEYLRRGGFLLIDPCIASATTGSVAGFVERHREIFARLLPGAETRSLPEDHPLFRCYFTVTKQDLFTADMVAKGAPVPADSSIYGVFLNGRMVAVLTGAGLECGWPQTPQREPGCMKMIVNMYVYAMTRTPEVAGVEQ
jgi:hypothetical protein